MPNSKEEARSSVGARPAQVNPTAAESRDAFTVSLLLRGDYHEAAMLLEAAIATSECGFSSLYYLALASYKMGNFQRAEKNALRALALEPENPRALYLSGLVLKDSGRFEEAAESFTRALRVAPERSRILLERALAYYFLERPEDARGDLEEAARLEPDRLPIWHNLAVVANQIEDYESARKALGRCLELATGRDKSERYARFLVQLGRREVYRGLTFEAHRLKNLVGILGDDLGTFLRDDCSSSESPETDSRRKRLREIYEQVTRLFSDMGTFLTFLKPQGLELDLVDIHELLDRALFTAGAQLKRVTMKKDYSPDVPEIVCDTSEIGEAFLNVVVNAIEAMKEGGLLVVTTRVEESSVAVSFADTGEGLPEGDLEKIFQFGYSTKQSGSGVGLAQARRAVLAHGGRIRAEPNEPRGVTITISLPQRPEGPDSESGPQMSLLVPLEQDLRELLLREAERSSHGGNGKRFAHGR